jgi:hypothetical protein
MSRATPRKRIRAVAFHETILGRGTSLGGTRRCAALCDVVTV